MTDEKVRENRARLTFKRRGMELRKSRTRDPQALDYGLYTLHTPDGSLMARGKSIDQVEEWVRGFSAIKCPRCGRLTGADDVLPSRVDPAQRVCYTCDQQEVLTGSTVPSSEWPVSPDELGRQYTVLCNGYQNFTFPAIPGPGGEDPRDEQGGGR
jgi:hypothetical protein